MNRSNLVFDDEILWEGSLRAVRLCATLGDDFCCFHFDASAINDYYQTTDSREMAIQSFESHRPGFESMVRQMISDGVDLSEHGAYFVGMAMLHKYQP